MSGVVRFPRPYLQHNVTNGGDNSTQTLLDLDRGGETVYVQYKANESNANEKTRRRIKQPNTYHEKHLDDDDEVLVGKFDYEEFVWWSEYLTGELPVLYKQVLEELRVWKSYYSFDLHGFTCFRHKEDKGRRCDVKYIYLPQIACGKYHPYASVKHRRRASMRTLERLEYLERKTKELERRTKKFERRRKNPKHKFDYLIKLDLTLQKWVSMLWDNEETQVKIREAVKRFLEILHDKRFPNKKSHFGVICNHHYWRTKKPLEPHRHIHVTMPNVCYNKSENKFYRFSPYLEEEELKDLKRCWKKALLEYGLWRKRKKKKRKKKKKEKEQLPDCKLRYIKFSDRSWVIHRLSYCCRKPTEDLIEYLRAEDLDNFEDVKEFARFLINYTPRVVNLGFLTNLKRFGYYSNKSTTMICPICGGKMVVLCTARGLIESLDRPPPHAPKLLRDRECIWHLLS